MRNIIIATLALLATPATAQIINPGDGSIAGNVTVAIPTAGTTLPPGVSDTGAIGTMTTQYALANHTHASKARKIITTTATDGSYTYNYSAVHQPACMYRRRGNGQRYNRSRQRPDRRYAHDDQRDIPGEQIGTNDNRA